MKKTVFVLLSVCALISVGALGAFARSDSPVTVKIPFAFYAGDQYMPAGQYVFQFPTGNGFATGTMVKLTSVDFEYCQHMLSRRVEGVTTDTDFHVTFTKYGDVYFLSSVRDSEFGATIHPAKMEKQLARERAAGSGTASTVEYKFTRSNGK